MTDPRSLSDLTEAEVFSLRSRIERALIPAMKEFGILHGSTADYNLYSAVGRAIHKEWKRSRRASESRDPIPPAGKCVQCGLPFPEDGP